MKRIIDGKRYNTETAELLCRLPCDAQTRSDFHWHRTHLYRTPRGRNFFIAGEGSAASMWAEPVGNMWGPGAGLRPVSAEDARGYLEAADEVEVIERLFGAELEDA